MNKNNSYSIDDYNLDSLHPITGIGDDNILNPNLVSSFNNTNFNFNSNINVNFMTHYFDENELTKESFIRYINNFIDYLLYITNHNMFIIDKSSTYISYNRNKSIVVRISPDVKISIKANINSNSRYNLKSHINIKDDTYTFELNKSNDEKNVVFTGITLKSDEDIKNTLNAHLNNIALSELLDSK